MQKHESRLTVYFEDPFWVGVYERIGEGRLEVCKITFGAEPGDNEVYAFLLQNWHRLRFGPSVPAQAGPGVKVNPKRMQRAIKRQLEGRGVGTKSQQALQAHREAGKAARKEAAKRRRETEKDLRFDLRQQKKKEKHRGH